MTSNWLYDLAFVGSFIPLFAYAFAFFIVYSKRHLSRRAAMLVWTALGIWTFSTVANWVIMIGVSRFYGPSMVGQISMGMRPVMAILSAVALILFTNAVFIDREPGGLGVGSRGGSRGEDNDVFLDGDNTSSPSDANPYTPPR